VQPQGNLQQDVEGPKMCVQTTHGVEVQVGGWLFGFSAFIDRLMMIVSLFAINILPFDIKC
jgi:hypothetical protein